MTSTAPDPELGSEGSGPGDDKVGRVRFYVAQARGRSDEARVRFKRLEERVRTERDRIPLLDAGFEAFERDRSIGGGLLGGALAFRLFLVVLPTFLAGVALFGFAAEVDPTGSAEVAQRMGLAESTAAAMAQSARLEESRWTTLILAIGLTLMALRLLVKSLRVAEALAWQIQPPRMRLVRSVGVAVVILLVFAAVAAAGGWTRARTPGGGVLVSSVMIVVWLLPWAAVFLALPRSDGAPWTSVLPGAFVMAVATQLLHAASVYYFSRRIPEMSDRYGPLGFAALALLWLYVAGRAFVGASVVNATIWHRWDRGVETFPRALHELIAQIEKLQLPRR